MTMLLWLILSAGALALSVVALLGVILWFIDIRTDD